MLHNIAALAGPARRWPGAFTCFARTRASRVVTAGLLSPLLLAPVEEVGAQPDRATASRQAVEANRNEVEVVDLDTLIARALAVHPAIRAASAQAEAAKARVSPAGAWPDPMLMAGIQNVPISRERLGPGGGHGTPPTVSSGPDPMTMRMVGVVQTIPYPGKLSLQRRVAEREIAAAEASIAAARRRIAHEVSVAYYELAFIDRAFAIVERNQGLVVRLIHVTEGRYGIGAAGQQDVLKAQVEASRLAETAVALAEQRGAAVARLNALLDRPSERSVGRATVPPRVARAAVADSATAIRFVSSALGARVADSPIPALIELQERALRESPDLREHEAMIGVQAARLDLVGRAALPDADVSLQYGQRSGYPDMVTATVTLPIPIHRRRKQDQLVTAARSELAALVAVHHAKQNEIRADVARLVSDLERERAQLALYARALLPQSQASLAAAVSSYQVGKVEFLSVLAGQATLFTYETEYFRALTDFAATLAELERVVGQGILR